MSMNVDALTLVLVAREFANCEFGLSTKKKNRNPKVFTMQSNLASFPGLYGELLLLAMMPGNKASQNQLYNSYDSWGVSPASYQKEFTLTFYTSRSSGTSNS